MAGNSDGCGTDWTTFVKSMVDQYSINTRRVAAPELVKAAAIELGFKTLDIFGLYSVTNGLSLDPVEVFPIEDPKDVRNTWRGVRRVNDPSTTSNLGGDQDLLKRFFVFAHIGGGCCAAIDREDGSLWYEEAGEFHQTTLSTAEFIDACLKEASE